MDKLQVTSDVKRLLSARYTPVSLVDDAGTIIGTYVPRLTLDDSEPEGGWPTAEELAADLEAAKNGPRHTTAEVIAHLRSLG